MDTPWMLPTGTCSSDKGSLKDHSRSRYEPCSSSAAKPRLDNPRGSRFCLATWVCSLCRAVPGNFEDSPLTAAECFIDAIACIGMGNLLGAPKHGSAWLLDCDSWSRAAGSAFSLGRFTAGRVTSGFGNGLNTSAVSTRQAGTNPSRSTDEAG